MSGTVFDEAGEPTVAVPKVEWLRVCAERQRFREQRDKRLNELRDCQSRLGHVEIELRQARRDLAELREASHDLL